MTMRNEASANHAKKSSCRKVGASDGGVRHDAAEFRQSEAVCRIAETIRMPSSVPPMIRR